MIEALRVKLEKSSRKFVKIIFSFDRSVLRAPCSGIGRSGFAGRPEKRSESLYREALILRVCTRRLSH